MTLGELAGYADEMEPLGAEWLLDAAQAAAYPATMQFAPELAKSWWESLTRAAAGAVQATTTAVKSASGFTLNGVSLGFEELRRQVSSALDGRGVSD